MAARQDRIRFGLSLRGAGYHSAAWRHPDVPARAEIDIAHYIRVVKAAEAARFDLVFSADALGLREESEDREALKRTSRVSRLEPITMLSALAVATERIGLVATASTSYNEPFHVARKFASLDHISAGRAGWNVVGSWSDNEARNFGREQHFDYAQRYGRAKEFVDVVRQLWNGWEPDALIRNKQTGIYFDPAKLHVLGHKGKHFTVRGPLNIERPPQGWPLISQAGQSDEGQELAAATADMVFTAQQSLEGAQAYYRSVKDRMAKYGRHPDHLKILPGVLVVTGATEAEAKEKFDYLQSLVDERVGLAHLSGMLGDLSGYPLDGPVPDISDPRKIASIGKLMREVAHSGDLTIRQLYLAMAPGRGHKVLVGSGEQIADTLQAWFEGYAADGFNLAPAILPEGIEDFAAHVVPVLQQRGLFRTEYEGATLRENLGVPTPVWSSVLAHPASVAANADG
jgi:FMN-dependent oxidoreductase (nitrilotriacetate monooxygenase family)